MSKDPGKLFESGDIPSFNPKVDLARLKMSPKDAFVLSRVDGRLSVEKISSASGVPLAEVCEILKRLAACGALKFEKTSPARDTSKPKERLSILEQLEEDEKYESLAAVPRQTRREILMAEDDIQKNHYDFFNVSRDVSGEKLKKVYFRFSKDFHPDRFFGKEIGIYKRKLEKIFLKATEAFETLSDKLKRQKYDEATFEDVKMRAEKEKTAQENFSRPKTLIERLGEAKKFFELGRLEHKKKNILSAANYYKLAMVYDPSNKDYVKAYETARPELDKKRARAKYEEGMGKADAGDYESAIELLSEAVDLIPYEAEYNYRLAKLLLGHKNDCVKSKELCLRALDTMGDNPEVRITMGRIYKLAGLFKNAAREFKTALKLDKENQTAKMELEDID